MTPGAGRRGRAADRRGARGYVERMPGSRWSAVAHSAGGARGARRRPVDLVLLDMYLPDRHGLELLRRCARRARRATSSRSPRRATWRSSSARCRRGGAVPAQAVHVRGVPSNKLLEQYAAFRRTLEAGDDAIDQRGVDAVFGAMRPAPRRRTAAQGTQRRDARGGAHDARRGGERAHRRRGRRPDRLVAGDGEALPGASRGPRAVDARHPLWRHRPPARGVSTRQVVTESGLTGPQALPTHHSPSSVERLVAERVDARALGQRVSRPARAGT